MITAGTGRLRSVAVVGAGTLGLTVTHAALVSGSPVTLLVRDRKGDGRAATAKRVAVAASLQREVRRGAMSATTAATLLEALHVTTHAADLASAEAVIEAIPEDVGLKRALLAELEGWVSPSCLIASSTSSIPAARLARGALHPERIVVAHYVWPAHRMRLVEVAMHDTTSAEARARLEALLRAQGKAVVRVADRAGFLITRALLAYWNEALQLVMEGVDAEAVDTALEGFGFPLGPLRLMDKAGLGTAHAVHELLASAVRHRFVALPRLQAVLDAGLPGFYYHSSEGRRPIPVAAAVLRGVVPTSMDRIARVDDETVVRRVVGALGGEVERAVDEGVVASWSEAGRAIDLAYNFPARQGGLHVWWLRQPALRDLVPAAL